MPKIISKQFLNLIPLALIVSGLISYNFMSAQWQSPTATAPNNNTEAPINISNNYQAKLGDLGAVRMRAGEYCNADGTVCVNDVQRRVSSTCPAGQAIQSINVDGTVSCQAVSGATCAIQMNNQSACVYSGSSVPPCPAGYTQIDMFDTGSCSTNNSRWVRQCMRVVC